MHVVVPFVPFDPDAWKGAAHARLRVAFPSGEPAVGKKVTVSWFDGHYGSHTLFDEALPEDGVVELRGVSWEAQADLPFGPYQVSLDNEALGFFRLERTEELQEFVLGATPGAGDMAPGFLFVNVETHEEHGVADFRGRVVVLEFWATSCGPCHPAMEKLLEMAAVHERDWKDRVVVLPISTDHRIDRVKTHIESRGWDTIPHYWSSREADEYFSSAEKKYAVYGIPQAILIDQEGRIAWRGDPSRSTDGPDLVERIQELLEP
jgi:thiol-disulfide isomerase/thioredoxin